MSKIKRWMKAVREILRLMFNDRVIARGIVSMPRVVP